MTALQIISKSPQNTADLAKGVMIHQSMAESLDSYTITQTSPRFNHIETNPGNIQQVSIHGKINKGRPMRTNK